MKYIFESSNIEHEIFLYTAFNKYIGIIRKGAGSSLYNNRISLYDFDGKLWYGQPISDDVVKYAVRIFKLKSFT